MRIEIKVNKQNPMSFNFYNCRIYYNTPMRHDRHDRNVQRSKGVKNKNRRHMNTNTQNRISFHADNCRNKRTYYYNTPIPRDRYVRRREVTKKKGNRRCYRCQSEDHLINYCVVPKTPRRASPLPPSSAVSPGPLERPALSVSPEPLERPASSVSSEPLVRPASPVLRGPLVRPASFVCPQPLVRPASSVMPGPRPLVRPASFVFPQPPKELKEQQQQSGD
ncbi:keratinocyte proline-rich protein-like isoform X1 [Aphis gossypii]|uniref:keratinocyte proline-rich protein-like isoform X1 n=2 Tax=Aphis gossypii TaxID=80765 RepID=UPI002158FB8E|nr:keratinocyte proline-rich protein-like isoform X1 [Aphis gossypii]XP_027839962.2 keratinocyte proline-rich protein-like isoform X1 [Aphis gossypii]XP_050057091.1 keratinocyte proline-rich protein-like isoform X1 [Aphis gossypii]